MQGNPQGFVQAVTESVVPVPHTAAALQFLTDQQIHIPGTHDPFQNADSGQVGQMLPPVLLPLRPGYQAAFRVVVHHGGGENVVARKADYLPVHIAQHLVHIQREIRKLLPGNRPVVPQTVPQFL